MVVSVARSKGAENNAGRTHARAPDGAGASARGRPTAAQAVAKHEAILEAGVALFLERGFERASMDAIARRAGVSKATVYSHYNSKVALFAAIVARRCGKMIPSLAIGEFAALPAAEALSRIGREFIALLLSPDAISFYRMVLASATRFPDLGRAFYAAGPDRISAQLAEYLRALAANGTLDADDPRLAAEHFFGMVLGHLDLRLLLGLTQTLSPGECERQVAAAVRAFLRAYSPIGAAPIPVARVRP